MYLVRDRAVLYSHHGLLLLYFFSHRLQFEFTIGMRSLNMYLCFVCVLCDV